MKNKFLFLVFFFILAFSFAGIVSAAQIVNRNDGMVCDKHGSSAGCVGGVWIGDESYQGYLGHVSILAQGYGALGPAGGKYGVDVCLNDSSVMWTGACKNMVNANTTGNIGDGQGLINDDLYIGDDPGPVIKYFVVSIYVNDAGTTGYAQIYGRKVTFDDFQPAGGADIKVGNQTDVTWATSGSIPGNPPTLSWSGPINCDQSGSVGASGGTTCTGLSAGTGQVSMTITGYSGNGPITITKSTNINVTTVSTQTAKYRCSGGGSCMRDDVYGDTTDSNCNNSCSAGSAPVVTLNASPSTISSGGSSTLSWNIAGTVTSCNASGGWTTPGTLSGTRSTGPLSATTAYGLSCSGPGGVGTANTTVTVNQSTNPSITLLGWGPPSVPQSAPVAGSLNITYGAMGGLVWNGQNVNNCKIYRADGSLAGSFPKDGNAPVGPITSNQAHTIICDADNGSGQVQSTFSHNTAAPSTVNIKGWGPPDNVVTDGPVNITQGSTGAVTWTSTNAIYCELYQNGLFTGHTELSPAAVGVGPINSTTSYQVNCTNGVGTDISSDTIVFIPISTPSIDLTAGAVSPSSATVGTPVAFSGIVSNNGGSSTGASFNNVFQVWLSGNGAPTVVSVNSLSALAGGATRTVNSSSYTFSTPGTHSVRLCADLDGGMSGSIPESDENNNCGPWTTITVSNVAAPSVSLLGWGPPSVPQSAPVAGSLNITYGAMGGLVWTSSNVNYCEIYRDGVDLGSFPLNGSAGVGPVTSGQTHTIVCNATNGSGYVSSSFTHDLVVVLPPTITFYASPTSITSGGSSTLTWTVSGQVNSCSASGGWSGSPSVSGGSQSTGSLFSSQTYNLSCTGPGGTTNANPVTVTVTGSAADLTAGPVSPISATEGSPVAFGATITNSGGTGTGGSFNNLFQVSDDGFTASTVSVNSRGTLASGTSGPVSSAAYTFTSSGTYYVRVCADNDNNFSGVVSESNESNNCGPWTTVTVSNVATAPTVSLTASPTSITSGGSSTLTWTVSGQVNSCSASGGWSGLKAIGGGSQSTGAITTTQTYNISCTGPGGTTNDSVTVTVGGSTAPTVSLTASPTSITSGGSSTLTWTVSGQVTSCSASGGWSGAKSISGGSQSTGSISTSQTYDISCTGPGGTGSDSVVVSVSGNPPPAVTFSASPTSITSGGSSTLSWTVSGSVTSCSASGGWSGTPSIAGGSQSTGALTTSQTYNLSCTGPGGTTNANPVTVTVTGSPADLTAGSVSPTSANTGSAVTFSATVTNSGGAGTGASFNNLFQVSTDGGNTASAISVNSRAALSSGTSGLVSSYTYTFSTAGTYSVRVCADNDSNFVGSVSESNENNNCGPWTDITVSTVATPPAITFKANPTSVTSGGSSTLTWTVSGQVTSCTASGGWSGAKAITGSSQSTGALTTSQTYDLSCTGPGGTTDAPSVVVTVIGSPADLMSSDISSASVNTNTPIAFTTTISNIGGTGTGTSFNNIFQVANDSSGSGAVVISTKNIPALVAGGSSSVTSASHSFTTAGTYYVRACADEDASFNDLVSESNEGNNCGAWMDVTVTSSGALPNVISPTATGITTTGATLGATVASLGNPASISERGTCYGTSFDPGLGGLNGGVCLAEGGTSLGSFTQVRSGMSPNTTYYYRGYATNPTGTGYSASGTTFNTPGLPVDASCGSASGKTYASSATTYSPDTLCAASFPVTSCTAGAAPNCQFPAQGGSVGWVCGGLNGGAPASCSASRNNPIVNVVVNVDNIKGGTVKSNDGGITCGADCSNPYIIGDTIVLTATPSSTYWKFNGWGDACASFGNSPVCTLHVNGDMTVKASFVPRIFDYTEF